jgi:HEAT repeat protein
MATLLANFPRPESRRTLRGLLLAADPNVRAAALASLAKIGDGGGDLSLIPLLADPQWFVRAQAARACGARRLSQALPALIGLLRDREWWVRVDAREAIEQIGPAAVDHLLRVLEDEDRFARNMAAEALENMGYVDAAVWDLTKGGEVRQQALRILTAIRRAEGVPGLADKIRRVDRSLLPILERSLGLVEVA